MSVSGMGQKSIVLYLSLKGMTSVEMYANLVAVLKTEAACYGSVTHYLCSPCFTASIDTGQSELPGAILTESDKAILAALEEHPFASVRKLARAAHLVPSTVYYHLNGKLGYTIRQLRWVTHILSVADKHVRTQLSFQLLELLESQMCRL
jgi:hypothetical protein